MEFKLLEFYLIKEIKYSFTVDKTSNEYIYDIIIGRDLPNQLGIDILYSKSHLVWDGIIIPMKLAANVKLKEFGQDAAEGIDEIIL